MHKFHDIDAAKYEVEASRRNIIERAESAIAVVERFLEDARRDLDRAKADPDARRGWGEFNVSQLPGQVMHAITWALANAQGDLQTADNYARAYCAAQAVIFATEAKS